MNGIAEVRDLLPSWFEENRGLLEESVGEPCWKRWEKFDLQDILQACAALWNASQGQNIPYNSSPAIGLAYSSWYHPQRVSTALDAVLSCLEGSQSREIRSVVLYDLGSGTGAVSWAVYWIYKCAQTQKIELPQITIVAVEESKPMQDYADILWGELQRRVGSQGKGAQLPVKIQSQRRDWRSVEPIKTEATESWIIASYLFDYPTDGDEVTKSFREIEVTESFGKLVNKIKPAEVALVTPPAKKAINQKVLKGAGFDADAVSVSKCKLYNRESGQIGTLQRLRDLWKSDASDQQLVVRNPDTQTDDPAVKVIRGDVCWVPKDVPKDDDTPSLMRASRTVRSSGPGETRDGKCQACEISALVTKGYAYYYCRDCYTASTGLP